MSIDNKFVSKNSLDGGFLQSDAWSKFQGVTGKKSFKLFKEGCFWANIIKHDLPVVGNYLYIPRGPIFSEKKECKESIRGLINELVGLAKKNNSAWIRIELNRSSELDLVRELLDKKGGVREASVNMQPREIFCIDISKNEDDLLLDMKPKTRYNVRLAKRRDVKIKEVELERDCDLKKNKYFFEFLKLVDITAQRKGVNFHDSSYYRYMVKIIPKENLRLYVAIYKGEVVAANLISFYGNTATYLHGASGNKHRKIMAPFLLQWKIMLDAKKKGIERYDFGGVATKGNSSENEIKKLDGVTRFKMGFSKKTKPIVFPGTYDVVVNPFKYNLYLILQKLKNIF